MDDVNENYSKSQEDIPRSPPAIIHCDKTKKFSQFSPIIISETESHNKRLSFEPMIVPEGEHGLLRGHLVYEPIEKGHQGTYSPIKDTNKIGKKDVSAVKKQKIDLELNSGEIETLRCVLNSLKNVADRQYEDIHYRQIDQLFSFDDLHKILKDNWHLAQVEPKLYKILMSLTETPQRDVADIIATFVEELEGKPLLSDKPLSSKFISSLVSTLSNTSSDDVEMIISLLTDDSRLLLKQHLNIVELKSFITKLKTNVELDKGEDYWQELIMQNSWIISQLFAYPFVFQGDKVHVSGQTLKKDGGVVDFLANNKITSNVSLVEIKNNYDNLVKSKPYREGLKTYSMSDDLIGGVVQVLDYKNTLISNSHTLLNPEHLNSFNPQCVLIIGRIKNLNPDQIKSFELYRSELKDVTIITYDELISRVELILACLEKTD